MECVCCKHVWISNLVVKDYLFTFFLKKHVVYTVVVVGYFDFFLSYFESTIMFCDMILTILAIYLATKPSFKVEKFNGMCTVYYFTYSVNFGKYFGNIL